MAFLSLKALFFIQLSLLLLTYANVFAHIAQPPKVTPAPAPKPHNHHHHHKHPPPPAHPPVKPPAHPPVKPPVHPPVKPPVHPPVKPPVHPPVYPPHPAPVHPPVHPPTYAPAHPPVKPPTHAPTPLPPRKFVVVQGVVYCKDCKYKGIDTLLKAKPLYGAIVRLQCRNTRYTISTQTKTDKNGYFTIYAPKTISTYGVKKCKVFIVSSPMASCNKLTNLRSGQKGALLIPAAKPPVSSKRPASPYDLFNVGPFAFEPAKKCKH